MKQSYRNSSGSTIAVCRFNFRFMDSHQGSTYSAQLIYLAIVNGVKQGLVAPWTISSNTVSVTRK